MESDQEKTTKIRTKIPPLPEDESGSQISLARKIIIGVFIVGYWVFYYWFQEP